MRPETTPTGTLSHPTCAELLPWYVNSTLERGESEAVEAHLGRCDDCRAEVETLRRLAGAVREQSPETKLHGDFAAVERAIDARERVAFRASAPVRWILAAQAAAIVALLAGLLWTGPRPEREFQTLSDTAVVRPADGERLRVAFAPEARETEIRRLLIEISGQIVGGPNRAGAYVVLIEPGGTAAGSARDAVARLRRDPLIRLVEPLDGA